MLPGSSMPMQQARTCAQTAVCGLLYSSANVTSLSSSRGAASLVPIDHNVQAIIDGD